MKKIITKLCWSLVIFLFSIQGFAGESSDQLRENQIKTIIQSWMRKNEIPGVVVQLVDHGVSHAYHFGLADKENAQAMTDDTIFELGTLTKIFTNILLAEEVLEGRMSFDSRIADYVPDLTIANKAFAKISLFELSMNTSGLPFSVSNELTQRSQLPEYFSHWMPYYPIGSVWQYSNINSGLLGYALEASTHENINELYRNRILHPLGMELIGIDIPKGFEKKDAKGYGWNGKAVDPAKHGIFPAANGLKASGHDMQLFLRAALQLQGTPPKIAQSMHLTQAPSLKTKNGWYGMGWEIHAMQDNRLNTEWHPSFGPTEVVYVEKKNRRSADSHVLIDKMGYIYGFCHYIALVPSRMSGIVIMANKSISDAEIVQVGRKILFQKEMLYVRSDRYLRRSH